MSGETPKRYWKSWEERHAGALPADEFPERLDLPVIQFNRRDFLRAAGFTLAGAALAGCTRAPVEKAIPYLVQPEEIVPGRSYFYASTCAGCSAGCGLLGKVRDGRPIKLEGNPEHPLSRGGLCAVGQASLLGLYDSQRPQTPLVAGHPASWDEVDRALHEELASLRSRGGAVRFFTGTITSPTVLAWMERFLATFPNARHVVYDPLSSSALLEAHALTHGVRALPRVRLERAEVIASFDADFLGTGMAPVEFTAGYRAGRDLEATPPRFSYHVQFESRMSLTGTKADRRVRVAPGEFGLVLTHLVARLARRARARFATGDLEEPPVAADVLDDLARHLWTSRGRSVVLCGSQDVPTQVLTNYANHLLGNYGATLDWSQPSRQRQGNDRELETLLGELTSGKVAALFVSGVNPVYDLPGGRELAAALERTPLVVSLAEQLDETASRARYVCPTPHFLESWGDAEPVSGVVSLFQPLLHPFGQTRSLLESLATWSGRSQPAYELLRAHWERAFFPRQKQERSFDTFWDRALHDGYAEVEPKPARPKPFRLDAVQPIGRAARPAPGAFALVLYPKVCMLDGRHAHNPWLQELPDPVTKVAWDNYACLSPSAAARLEVAEGDVIRLEVSGGSEPLELPAYVQPGQHDGVVAVALGYGRQGTERFAQIGPQWLFGGPGVGEDGRVGRNAAPLGELADGCLHYERHDVRLTKTGKKHTLASTQRHHTLTVPQNIPLVGGQRREIVEELTLPAFLARVAAGEETAHNHNPEKDLWPPDHTYPVHRWAMAIDLTACTGCGACILACQAENNIPVVGKDEVARQREMHWLRIDRYYAGDDDDVEVVHQPLLCQQCDYAPCESVCPVLATLHSEEGLNEQIYNRCVGTRYCANNCPYKARRFNWFDYRRDDRRQNLALNPDVTVRSRGVMEKCTFCVQRIQEAKIEAKHRAEPLGDGDIQTACQQSCPAQAVVFGDLNDPKSRVAQLARSPRSYRLLAEFNFRPAVRYLAVVRNREETVEVKHHG
jgi:molybdopterin-containing oxidoreductase family iron-sulfur binding subunit